MSGHKQMSDGFPFLGRGCEFDELIQSGDWQSNSLGMPVGWCQSLKSALRTIFASCRPMAVFWGNDRILFYNDAYQCSFGLEKYSSKFGVPARDAISEFWHILSPACDLVMRGQGSTCSELQLFSAGQLVETEDDHWTYSFDPIHDPDAPFGVGGVLVICSKTTGQVLAARKAEIERECLAQLFEQSPSFIAVLIGREHIIEFVNPSYLKLVGHRDVVGRKAVEAFPEMVEQGYLALLDEVFNTGVTFAQNSAEITLRGASDNLSLKRVADFVIQPTRDMFGNITGVFVEGIDVSERSASDEALRRGEEQLRLATEYSAIGLWDVDPIKDRLYWPPRVKAMFGIFADFDVSMAHFYAGLHPDDSAHTIASYAAACDPAVRSLYDAEFRTIGKEDGVIRWIAAKGRALFNDRGECIRVIGTAIDITARKSAALRERFLLDLLDRLRDLYEPTAIIAEAINALGRHLGANRVGYGQVQDDNKTIILETCFVNGVSPITGAFQVDTFGAHNIALHRQGKNIVVADVNVDPRNDHELWASIETRAFISVPLVRDGRFRASLFVNRQKAHEWSAHEVTLIEEVARRLWDAVERARAEEALRIVNSSLGELVDARTRERDRIWRLSPLVMVVGDSRGILIEANPAWFENLGWTLDETLGRDVMEFVAPADREAAAAGMAQLFQGKPVVEYKLGFLHKNGQRRTIAWTTVPEGDRLYGFGRDITEQILAEEKLHQAQKMEAVGQLTGGIAHDFNNMLAIIIGSLDMARRRLTGAEHSTIPKCIKNASDGAARAAQLTSRLLAFSRQQPLEPRVLDPNKLVTNAAELLRSTIGEPIAIETILAGGLWHVFADSAQLESAIVNLAVNGRDAMPNGGKLIIETTNTDLDERYPRAQYSVTSGQYAMISITDTGFGMPPEVMEHAFDPFYTTKGVGKGTGLGLSQVYGFVKQSGGHVEIHSEPGEGTTVKIYLPRHTGDIAVSPKEWPLAAIPDGETDEIILLVEDDARVRNMSVDALRELGYSVIPVGTPSEALDQVEMQTSIALLFTDIVMPEMSGRELAELVGKRIPNLKVLFTTGYTRDTIFHNGLVDSGMAFLPKPFTLDQLAWKVRRAIDGIE